MPNQESLIFSKIVRHIAGELPVLAPEVPPEDARRMGEVFSEIAEAFESTDGFEFTSEQALPLSHAFTVLEVAMRGLSSQANESGHDNAAAKLEWAALQARGMTARLEEKHLAGEDGTIAFGQGEGGGEGAKGNGAGLAADGAGMSVPTPANDDER